MQNNKKQLDVYVLLNLEELKQNSNTNDKAYCILFNEKEFIDMKKSIFYKNEKYRFCEICLNCIENQDIKICKLCNCNIHIHCFKANYFEGDFCSRCSFLLKKANYKKINCILCQETRGLMIFDNNLWMHYVCCEFYKILNPRKKKINFLDLISKKIENTCTICLKECIFNLKCKEKICNIYIHPFCGYKEGVITDISKDFFCIDHLKQYNPMKYIDILKEKQKISPLFNNYSENKINIEVKNTIIDKNDIKNEKTPFFVKKIIEVPKEHKKKKKKSQLYLKKIMVRYFQLPEIINTNEIIKLKEIIIQKLFEKNFLDKRKKNVIFPENDEIANFYKIESTISIFKLWNILQENMFKTKKINFIRKNKVKSLNVLPLKKIEKQLEIICNSPPKEKLPIKPIPIELNKEKSNEKILRNNRIKRNRDFKSEEPILKKKIKNKISIEELLNPSNSRFMKSKGYNYSKYFEIHDNSNEISDEESKIHKINEKIPYVREFASSYREKDEGFTDIMYDFLSPIIQNNTNFECEPEIIIQNEDKNKFVEVIEEKKIINRKIYNDNNQMIVKVDDIFDGEFNDFNKYFQWVKLWDDF